MKNSHILVFEGIGYPILFSLILLITLFIFANGFGVLFFFSVLLSSFFFNLYLNDIIIFIIIILGTFVGLIQARANFLARCNLDSSYEILKKNPDDIEALLMEAISLMELSVFSQMNKQASKPIFEKVLQLDPNNQIALQKLKELSKDLKTKR